MRGPPKAEKHTQLMSHWFLELLLCVVIWRSYCLWTHTASGLPSQHSDQDQIEIFSLPPFPGQLRGWSRPYPMSTEGETAGMSRWSLISLHTRGQECVALCFHSPIRPRGMVLGRPLLVQATILVRGSLFFHRHVHFLKLVDGLRRHLILEVKRKEIFDWTD
jgi:hypothetical protein